MPDLLAARKIIGALADGVDPRSGQLIPPGSPIDSSDVIRALHAALSAMDRELRRSERKAVLPSNAGKPWNSDDDRELAERFDSGQSVAKLASAFERTKGSIASRLVILGKVPDRQSAFVANLNGSSRNT